MFMHDNSVYRLKLVVNRKQLMNATAIIPTLSSLVMTVLAILSPAWDW